MDKPLVLVIMSTYNGEKYIEEQIQSIMTQEGVEVSLLIRDDGSKDQTVKLLQDFQSRWPNIEVHSASNVGSAKSFFILLEWAVSKKFDYVALSDQDDVWDSKKLAKAVSLLSQHNGYPCLYCSNLKVVDVDLHFIRHMNGIGVKPDKKTALLRNILTGCTAVMNHKFIELLASLPIPTNAVMHDWWLYLLGVYFGKVVYDDDAYINYRQHGSNVYGARSNSWLSRLKGLTRSLKQQDKEHYRQIQAVEFLEIIGPYLNHDDKKRVSEIAHYRDSLLNRLRLALNFKTLKGLNLRLRSRILLGLI